VLEGQKLPSDLLRLEYGEEGIKVVAAHRLGYVMQSET
jgi:hypothetical protein